MLSVHTAQSVLDVCPVSTPVIAVMMMTVGRAGQETDTGKLWLSFLFVHNYEEAVGPAHSYAMETVHSRVYVPVQIQF
jgi:hypothetical protein